MFPGVNASAASMAAASSHYNDAAHIAAHPLHLPFATTPSPDDPTASFMAAASALQQLTDSRGEAAAIDAAIRAQSVQLPTTLAPWQIQQISEEEFFASLPVFDMFPLSNGDENHVILYALVSF
jgi:hypothetical protein